MPYQSSNYFTLLFSLQMKRDPQNKNQGQTLGEPGKFFPKNLTHRDLHTLLLLQIWLRLSISSIFLPHLGRADSNGDRKITRDEVQEESVNFNGSNQNFNSRKESMKMRFIRNRMMMINKPSIKTVQKGPFQLEEQQSKIF
ncbi:uncharacterized protein LOC111392822 [Olea europaea var. sylvestris]|uniref:uncharacterized protein LOC111392822 n=1 Tax=Olea europaea var. sylvestris TaxID=158386 RepID=UPI000C1CF4B8|nr:uncharacterized protein LOC111392822 [Olea europaea var. sylvestris]